MALFRGYISSMHFFIFLIGKRGNARLGAAQDQGVDIVRAFVGVYHFQIH